jgi:hypothetical protein
MLSQTLLGHDGHVTGDLIVLARHQRFVPSGSRVASTISQTPHLFYLLHARYHPFLAYRLHGYQHLELL